MTDYTRALEIAEEYSKKLKDVVDEYNATMHNEFDNFVSACFSPFAPHFHTDKPSEGFKPWFKTYFRKDIAGTYICEDTTVETGLE